MTGYLFCLTRNFTQFTTARLSVLQSIGEFGGACGLSVPILLDSMQKVN